MIGNLINVSLFSFFSRIFLLYFFRWGILECSVVLRKLEFSRHERIFYNNCSHFYAIPVCDRQMDRQTSFDSIYPCYAYHRAVKIQQRLTRVHVVVAEPLCTNDTNQVQFRHLMCGSSSFSSISFGALRGTFNALCVRFHCEKASFQHLSKAVNTLDLGPKDNPVTSSRSLIQWRKMFDNQTGYNDVMIWSAADIGWSQTLVAVASHVCTP